MHQPSTIVLAVVNFTRDLQLSLVRDIVNSELAIYQRTLGVMMKPVWALGKDAQESYQVVRNNDGELRLGLGRHVTGCSSFLPMLEHEDLQRAGIWSALPSADVGAASLRNKLSDRLFTASQRELARLLNEMTRKMTQVCEGKGKPHMQI